MRIKTGKQVTRGRIGNNHVFDFVIETEHKRIISFLSLFPLAFLLSSGQKMERIGTVLQLGSTATCDCELTAGERYEQMRVLTRQKREEETGGKGRKKKERKLNQSTNESNYNRNWTLKERERIKRGSRYSHEIFCIKFSALYKSMSLYAINFV